MSSERLTDFFAMVCTVAPDCARVCLRMTPSCVCEQVPSLLLTHAGQRDPQPHRGRCMHVGSLRQEPLHDVDLLVVRREVKRAKATLRVPEHQKQARMSVAAIVEGIRGEGGGVRGRLR